MTARPMQVPLTFIIYEEDGQFVAHCRELGTATCGDTMDEAARNIREAVTLHLETLEDLGEKEKYFKQKGIELQPVPQSVATSQKVPKPVPQLPKRPRVSLVQVPAMRVPKNSFVSRQAFPM